MFKLISTVPDSMNQPMIKKNQTSLAMLQFGALNPVIQTLIEQGRMPSHFVPTPDEVEKLMNIIYNLDAE